MSPQEETPRQDSSKFGRSVTFLLVLAQCGIAGITTFYFVRENRQTGNLAASNQLLTAKMQSQLQAISDKLNALTTAPPPQSRASAVTARTHPKPKPHRMVAEWRPADDPRWRQIQSQLSDQQKQLASTREEVEKTRSDLDGRLNSTRDELNGSVARTNGEVARTHEQLVALEKRGERNYYEFQLDKSKSFQRIGPISVSLRKVDVKRKHYNLAMMVNDFQLDKKNINLYEPVWLTLSDRPQPVELVVNQVLRDHIQGYVSEPKYSKSQLAASTAAPAAKPQGTVLPQ
jgi:uncharacterized coiled-coil protein SlyX